MKTSLQKNKKSHWLIWVFIFFWTFLFAYPSIWHLTIGEHWTQIRTEENLGAGIEMFFYPFMHKYYSLCYPIHSSAKLDECEIFINPQFSKKQLVALDGQKKSPLFYSITYLNATFTRLLLENGAPINDESFKALKFSPMYPAVLKKNKPLKKVLMKYGAKTNIHGANGNTPLHIAIKTNQPEIVDYAINNHENLEITNSDGQTPLEYAVINNNLKAVIALAIGGANYEKDFESKDLDIQIFLARCKNSKNPEKSATFLSENHQKPYNKWRLPAEFPVEIKK